MKLSNKQRAGAGLAAAGSREMAASAAASAGCAVILEEASSEGEEGDTAAPPPPSSAPPPPPASLIHSLSVPGHVQDTPYHKLRRASHHIISGRSQDLLQLCCRAELTLLKMRFFCNSDKTINSNNTTIFNSSMTND